jgi:hypothetical protein
MYYWRTACIYLLQLFVGKPVPKLGGPGLLNRTIPRKMEEEDMMYKRLLCARAARTGRTSKTAVLPGFEI